MNDAPETIVRRQVEAYNRHDLEDFLAFYHENAQILKFPSGEILMNGREQMRASYGEWFAEGSKLSAEIASRIVQGSFVIDKERISGMTENKTVEATVIYEVSENSITKAWFILDA